MQNITFENIHVSGKVILENDFFRQVHFEEMLNQYDSNFIEFKRMPTLEQFQEKADYLREFHDKYGQEHIRFYFPPNEKPSGDLQQYMEDGGFQTGFLELYAIEPSKFKGKDTADIEVKEVSEEDLHIYLQLQYDEDSSYGVNYAESKREFNRKQFDTPALQQILAFYKGEPAGYTDIIIGAKTVEIDNLAVIEKLQKKGAGSKIQRFVMESFPDKTVILVADGDDTAKEMYKKQNYQYLGFRYDTLKLFPIKENGKEYEPGTLKI
ncbi:GNAT family N-acetyltransferase [Evansella clarkii]|uniref:GNAT family N-acetyltransferase n=1 Tax=Evansella clarkii TaxID=79879 RepID=UPI000B44E700|nr:GNAT family N-acetyltransferase [Evansella clarkii]